MAAPVFSESLVPVAPVTVEGDFKHISERLGAKTDIEYLEWINEQFLLSDDFSFDLITSRNTFALTRHEENVLGRDNEDIR